MTSSSAAGNLSPLPAPADAPPEMPQFDRSRNGYHPSQVHQWASGLLTRIRELEGELAGMVGKAGHTLLHDAGTPQGHAMLADLMKVAADEINGQKLSAAEEVAQMFRQAEEEIRAKHEQAAATASKTLTDSDLQASRLVAGAREQADTVLQTAHAQAKAITDDAAAHAAAVHEGAQRRMGALVGLHTETAKRLRMIHDVTGKLMDEDDARGSLEDEIARITSGAADQEGAALPLPATVSPTIAIAAEPEVEADAEVTEDKPAKQD